MRQTICDVTHRWL